MSAVRSEASMDAVERRKLHLHMADLRREAQNLRKLVDLTRPAQMPALLPRFEGAKDTRSISPWLCRVVITTKREGSSLKALLIFVTAAAWTQRSPRRPYRCLEP